MGNSKAIRKFGVVNETSREHIIRLIRNDATEAKCESQLTELLSHVIHAYCELHFLQRHVEATSVERDAALRIWRNVQTVTEQGLGAEERRAMAAEQYYAFRSFLEAALGNRKKAESNLRYLMGLAEECGREIHVTELPASSLPNIDWKDLKKRALAQSPSCRQQQDRIEIRANEVGKAKSQIVTRQRLGTAEDNSPKQAVAQLQLDQLELSKERTRLKDTELHTIDQLDKAVRALDAQLQLAETARLRLESAQKQVDSAWRALDAGTNELGLLLDAQRERADAEAAFNQSQTRSALATTTLQLRDGTLLQAYGYKLAVAGLHSSE